MFLFLIYNIDYSFYEKKIRESLISKNEIIEYEKKINQLLNYEYNIVFPTELLHIYQLVDKTAGNKKLGRYCTFLFIFIMFCKSFMSQKLSFVVLTIYYFSKITIEKKMEWSYDLQLISGYDKKTIMNNINKLKFEIDNKDILYIFLFKHYYFLIN
jgi:hypothetical protein